MHSVATQSPYPKGAVIMIMTTMTCYFISHLYKLDDFRVSWDIKRGPPPLDANNLPKVSSALINVYKILVKMLTA